MRRFLLALIVLIMALSSSIAYAALPTSVPHQTVTTSAPVDLFLNFYHVKRSNAYNIPCGSGLSTTGSLTVARAELLCRLADTY